MSNQRKLPPFKEFIKRPKYKVNEDSLNIEIPWFQDCVDSVIAEIETDLCIQDYEDLERYVKDRNKVLGVECSDEQGTCLPFIKELVYRHSYGLNIDVELTPEQEKRDMPAKAIAVNKIADEVMKLIGNKSSSTHNAVAPWLPQDPGYDPDYPGEYCVDLPTSYESRAVSSYERFSNVLEMKSFLLNKDYHDKCLNYCLDKIKEKAGSLNYGDVLDMVGAKVGTKDEEEQVKSFIFTMAMLYLDGNLNEGKKKEDTKKKVKPDIHLDQAAQVKFCNKIVKEVMEEITKETKKKR